MWTDIFYVSLFFAFIDLGLSGDNVYKQETRVFGAESTVNRVEMHKIGVERGINWSSAMDIYQKHTGDEDGFYASNVC